MSAYSNAVKEYIDRYKKEVDDSPLIDPHNLCGLGLSKRLAQTKHKNNY